MSSHIPKLVTISRPIPQPSTPHPRLTSVNGNGKTHASRIMAESPLKQFNRPSHAIAEAFDAESIDESDLSFTSSYADTINLHHDDTSCVNSDRRHHRSDASIEIRQLREQNSVLTDELAQLKDKHARLKRNIDVFPIHDPAMPRPDTAEFKNMRQQLVEAQAEVKELKDHNDELLADIIYLNKDKVDDEDEVAKLNKTITYLSITKKELADRNEELLTNKHDLGEIIDKDLMPQIVTKDGQIRELEKQLKVDTAKAEQQLREKDVHIIALQEQINLFAAAESANSDHVDSMLSALGDPVDAATQLFRRMSSHQLVSAYNALHDCRVRLVYQPSVNVGAAAERESQSRAAEEHLYLSSPTLSHATSRTALTEPMTPATACSGTSLSSDDNDETARYIRTLTAQRNSSKASALPKSQAHTRERVKHLLKDGEGRSGGSAGDGRSGQDYSSFI